MCIRDSSYITNSFLTEMVNLKAEQGESKKLPVVWTSYLTGFDTGSKAINRTLAVEAVSYTHLDVYKRQAHAR